MFIPNNYKSKGYSIDFALKAIAESKGTLLVTPDILSACNHILPAVINNVVVFLGFGKMNPLRVPQGTIFMNDVFVLSSVIESLHGSSYKQSLLFCDVELPSRFPEAETVGRLVLSDKDFGKYRIKKSSLVGSYSNVSVSIRNENVLRGDLNAAFVKADRMDFMDYLKFMGAEFISDSDSVTVCEHCPDLIGPYCFAFPENLTVEGDIRFIDEANTIIPASCKIRGAVEIHGSY